LAGDSQVVRLKMNDSLFAIIEQRVTVDIPTPNYTPTLTFQLYAPSTNTVTANVLATLSSDHITQG
jgi:hypothetical protein